MTTVKSALIAALCALSACTPLPQPAGTPPPPPPVTVTPPAAPARPITPDAGPLLHIDTAQSLIVATVRRGGILARLGHDHVVASHTVTGTVSPSRHVADFTFRLDEMKIDEADLRRTAGLDKQPSADAIEGTRHQHADQGAGRRPLPHRGRACQTRGRRRAAAGIDHAARRHAHAGDSGATA
ncbi:conserved hypothetical protein [Ricinus communis]|uniref:Uncharacterized protein n=1 Tax=Ricinus communis TaxID=3988 RepID=B9TD58_RICCO|nr:conserved hypothetical protein [Ricinus communis]